MSRQFKYDYLSFVGTKVSRWFVESYIFSKGHHRFICTCECGNSGTPRALQIANGESKSCGCLASEQASKRLAGQKYSTTHGKSKTKAYKTWSKMLERTKFLTPKNKRYENYKNVTVDDSWHIFENFYKDMGDPPTAKHSLDRIDNTRGYYKENCRWATSREQMNNQSQTIFIEYKGRTQSLSYWCEELNLPYYKTYNRLRKGWTIERTFETP